MEIGVPNTERQLAKNYKNSLIKQNVTTTIKAGKKTRTTQQPLNVLITWSLIFFFKK